MPATEIERKKRQRERERKIERKKEKITKALTLHLPPLLLGPPSPHFHL
jgi:hypothetical protein